MARLHWFWRAAGSDGKPFLFAMVSVLMATVLPGVLAFRLTLLLRSDWDLTDSEFVVLLVLVAMLLAGLATLMYAFLIGLRSHNDPETRCRKCGYILRGLTEPRCSECGERI